MTDTTVAQLQQLLNRQRQSFAADSDPSHALRMDRLARLLALVDGHEQAIISAIDGDFGGRSPHETRMAELFVVRAGIAHAQSHLARWMRARRVPTALHFLPGSNRLLAQPLGVVGIISPWNYPLQLALGPALAALAAGNRVLLKPSELTPQLSALLAELVARYYAPEEMAVVTGDARIGQAFAALPLDHLFFTGSTQVGRQVAQLAAANLTPVTLELGGKSPAILDASCHLESSIRRIAFGKLLNAGQTCVAPDYLLVPRGQAPVVAQRLAQAMSALYPRLHDNPDYTAIISARHRERLLALVQQARAAGAQVIEVNPAQEDLGHSRKLAPMLILGATTAMQVMQEEIFGPLLPILEYDALEDAIAHVRQGPRPLALYWFGQDAARRDRVLRQTHAGGVTINDCLWHLVQEEQPFGGVGESGMGAYHGRWGFDTFSKRKPVFRQARWNGGTLLHPPYGKTFEWVLGLIRRLS
ncbi:coniferyl aldehyde dehydrogenase [Herbaspirillum rubrisubalbicans]|uniref:Aldehyde dehydrogenase n=1 Tax=Herbaspirillum rubrisubalbicans TaxID=80842 RepID=A0AAD0XHW9_9BURK|nr:coniferyl aldehyde dehydrogenase [Herbaspirillum rubrisubalbicans]AYR26841.1 coniferyl aldehyde dehydrogenase [Herbaspirillum rubrisubalbicans]